MTRATEFTADPSADPKEHRLGLAKTGTVVAAFTAPLLLLAPLAAYLHNSQDFALSLTGMLVPLLVHFVAATVALVLALRLLPGAAAVPLLSSLLCLTCLLFLQRTLLYPIAGHSLLNGELPIGGAVIGSVGMITAS